jgi:hypothetical protein
VFILLIVIEINEVWGVESMSINQQLLLVPVPIWTLHVLLALPFVHSPVIHPKPLGAIRGLQAPRAFLVFAFNLATDGTGARSD